MENLGSTSPSNLAGDGGPPKRFSEPSNEASKRESQQWKERGRQSQIFDGQNDVPQKTVTKTWKDAGRHCEIFDEKYNAPLKTPQRNWPWQERARRSSILDNSWKSEDNSVSNQKRPTASTTTNRRSSPTKEGGDASYSPSRNADVVDTSNSPSLTSVAGDAQPLSSPKLDNGNASPSRKSNNGNTPHSPSGNSDNGNTAHSPSRNSDTAESRSPHKWPWQEKALVSDIFGYQPPSRYGHDTGKLKKDYAWNQTKCTHDFGGSYSSNDRFQRGPNLGLSNTQAKNLKKANVTNGHDH